MDKEAMKTYKSVVGRMRRDLYLLYESLPDESLSKQDFDMLEKLQQVIDGVHGPMESGDDDGGHDLMNVPQCFATIYNAQRKAEELVSWAEKLTSPSNMMQSLLQISSAIRELEDYVSMLALSVLSPARVKEFDERIAPSNCNCGACAGGRRILADYAAMKERNENDR